jgi:transposase
MNKHRRHYTPEEKVAILRQHLLEKEPLSKLCDDLGLQLTVFYRRQKEFFENVAAGFEQKCFAKLLREDGTQVWSRAPTG